MQQYTPTEPSPSNSAVTIPPGRSGTDAVSPPDSTIEPGFDRLASSRQRLGQPHQRRCRMPHHRAAGRRLDPPTRRKTQPERRDPPGRRGAGAACRARHVPPRRCRRWSRAAGRVRVPRVDHLDGGQDRLGRGQHSGDRRRGLDPFPEQERDLRFRPRTDQLAELHRFAVRQQHPGRQTAEHGLVDVERLALDGTGQPQLRADHVLPGRSAVLDEQRLRRVGGLARRRRAASG